VKGGDLVKLKNKKARYIGGGGITFRVTLPTIQNLKQRYKCNPGSTLRGATGRKNSRRCIDWWIN